MAYSIGLNPGKTVMEFGLSEYDPEREDNHFTSEIKMELSKKSVQQLIKDLKDWERIMVEGD